MGTLISDQFVQKQETPASLWNNTMYSVDMFLIINRISMRVIAAFAPIRFRCAFAMQCQTVLPSASGPYLRSRSPAALSVRVYDSFTGNEPDIELVS